MGKYSKDFVQILNLFIGRKKIIIIIEELCPLIFTKMKMDYAEAYSR